MTMNLVVPIEMLEYGIASATTGPTTFLRTQVILNPSDYDGATYYFEANAFNSNSSTDYTLQLMYYNGSSWTAVTNGGLSLTHTGNSTVYRRRTGVAWTPQAGATQYAVQLPATASANQVKVYSARIIIVQSGATKTRIQIPLISYTYSTTSNSDAIGTVRADSRAATSYSEGTTTYSSWFQYVAANWSTLSGASAASFEAVIASSSTSYTATAAMFDTANYNTPIGALSGTTATTWTVQNTDFNPSSLSDGHFYRYGIKESSASGTCDIARAALYLRITSAALCEVWARVAKEESGTAAIEVLQQLWYNQQSSYSTLATTYLQAKGISNNNSVNIQLNDQGTNDYGGATSEVTPGLNFNSASEVCSRTAVTLTDGDRYDAYMNAETNANTVTATSIVYLVAGGTTYSRTCSVAAACSSTVTRTGTMPRTATVAAACAATVSHLGLPDHATVAATAAATVSHLGLPDHATVGATCSSTVTATKVSVATTGLVAEYVAALAVNGTSQGVNSPTPTGTWYDHTGNGDTGTLQTFAYTTSSGWAGSGTTGDPYRLQFDGGSDYVSLPDLGITEGSAWSFEAWFKCTNSGTVTLVGEGDDSGTARTTLLVSGTVLGNGSVNDAGGSGVPYGTVVVTGGGWHHGVATYDGTNLYIYTDGGDQQSAAGPGGTFTSTHTYIGVRAFNGSADRYFTDGIATIRIYNRCLSAAEVAANYNAGVLAASTPSTTKSRTATAAAVCSATVTRTGTMPRTGTVAAACTTTVTRTGTMPRTATVAAACSRTVSHLTLPDHATATATAAATVTRTGTMPRTAAATATCSSTVTKAMTAPRTATVAATCSSTVTKAMTAPRTGTASAACAATVTRNAIAFSRTATVAASASATVSHLTLPGHATATATCSRTVSHLTLPDHATATATAAATVTRTGTMPRTAAATATCSSTVTKAMTAPRTATVAATCSSTVTKAMTAPRTATASAACAATVTRNAIAFSRTATVAASASATVSHLTLPSHATASAAAAVTVTRTGTKPRTAAATATCATTVTRTGTMPRTASASAVCSTTVTHTGAMPRTAAVAATCSATVSHLTLPDHATASVTAATAVVRTGTMPRTASASAVCSTTVTKTMTAPRTVAQTASASAMVSHLALPDHATASVTAATAVVRTGTMPRTAPAGAVCSATATRNPIVFARTASVVATCLAAVTGSVAGVNDRTASVAAVCSVIVTRTGTKSRTAMEVATCSATVVRTGTMPRTATATAISSAAASHLTIPVHAVAAVSAAAGVASQGNHPRSVSVLALSSTAAASAGHHPRAASVAAHLTATVSHLGLPCHAMTASAVSAAVTSGARHVTTAAALIASIATVDSKVFRNRSAVVDVVVDIATTYVVLRYNDTTGGAVVYAVCVTDTTGSAVITAILTGAVTGAAFLRTLPPLPVVTVSGIIEQESIAAKLPSATTIDIELPAPDEVKGKLPLAAESDIDGRIDPPIDAPGKR